MGDSRTNMDELALVGRDNVHQALYAAVGAGGENLRCIGIVLETDHKPRPGTCAQYVPEFLPSQEIVALDGRLGIGMSP